MPNTKF